MKPVTVFTAITAAAMSLFLGSAYAKAPVPIDYFAIGNALDGVQLAPDGKHLAFRKLPAKDANYILEVYDTSDLSKRPLRFGATNMMIDSFEWLNSDYLWVDFRQRIERKVSGVNQGVWAGKSAIVRRDAKGEWRIMYDDASLVWRDSNNPDTVIIRTAKFNRRDLKKTGRSAQGSMSFSDISTPDWYSLNVENGRMKMILRGNDRLSGYGVDNDGNIRTASSYDPATREFIFYTRDPGDENDWREIYRYSVDSLERTEFVGFNPKDPFKAFVIANHGHDKTGVYLFDLRTGKFLDEVYRRNDVDIEGPMYSTDPNKDRVLTGFSYYADGKEGHVFLDPKEQALYAGIDAALPDTRNTVTSRSADGTEMTIFSQGSKDPGTYYLLKDGHLSLIGQRAPLLKPEDLGAEKFITYKARDGMEIPAIVTMPATGKAPYPLVVLPHGGPWVSETRAYDEWAALLSDNGYMVIQPQYRGSRNYGTAHWDASFGEWGKTMQDDLDDGALYLVSQGLADKNKIAIFGWSYGGYAAFVGSMRTPQVYQCSIAGAGVSDMSKIRADFTTDRLSRPLIRKAYVGLSPIDHVEDVNVPLLIVHGDVDQRVPFEHSQKFVDKLKGLDKKYKFVVLHGADHFSFTFTYEHRKILYTELLDWLHGPCGM